MTEKLMKGNEALGVAAIIGGCRHYFGYPITPQSELMECMARELDKVGGTFLQAESEVAAISMVYGAAAAGSRVLISSSSPGIALMQEGISYLAAAQLPCVIVNVSRGGPGLGNIQPSQADYYQNTKGGGNGDYRTIVYAPESIQEAADVMIKAFDIADRYRNPVIISADGMLGQMMEPVDLMTPVKEKRMECKSWALTGTRRRREKNIITTLYLNAEELEGKNKELKKKYDLIEKNETRYELYNMKKPVFIVAAYGTMARIVRSAIEILKNEGIEVGLVRPISLWPFPNKAFEGLPDGVKGIAGIEMSMGQMIDDVKIANNGRLPVFFYGRTGGMVPTQVEIAKWLKCVIEGVENN